MNVVDKAKKSHPQSIANKTEFALHKSVTEQVKQECSTVLNWWE